MIIEDARFGPIGRTSRKDRDVTLKVRPLVSDGAVNWKKNHAHKFFGDHLHITGKEVKIWYRHQAGSPQIVASFPETGSTNRTIHIMLPKEVPVAEAVIEPVVEAHVSEDVLEG